MSKKTVNEKLERLYFYEEKTIVDFISELDALTARYPDHTLSIRKEEVWDYETSHEELHIYGVRQETDKEYDKRIVFEERLKKMQSARAKKNAENSVKNEARRFAQLKKEYEKLKPKYEKN